MITGKIITGTTATVPTIVFTATAQTAVTTMILCNTETPNSSREADNSILVNIYFISGTGGLDNSSIGDGALVASKLLVPAGESIIFSDERIILDTGDSIQVGYEMTLEHLAVPLSAVPNALTVTVSTLPV